MVARRDGARSSLRVIVKPVFEHGSLGIDPDSVTRGADAARKIAERSSRWETEHFAEAYIDGREFAVAMMEGTTASKCSRSARRCSTASATAPRGLPTTTPSGRPAASLISARRAASASRRKSRNLPPN